jgi:hypothetical protein
MDRRIFLTGLLGFAGTAAIAGTTRPQAALAGVPNAGIANTANGVLDELDEPGADLPDLAEPEEGSSLLEQINHRRGHGRRRRRRRRVWRRQCRRVWINGRRQLRCYRRRIWIWINL